LGKIVNRLTLFGALSLGLLAIMPILAQAFLETDIAIGGTSILILVAVALETLRQIESQALMVTYDQYEAPGYLTGEPEEVTANRRLLRRKKR
jgi:preprotein translocase subunit SecY